MIFLKFLLGAAIQKREERHPNNIELASWLVHVLCDFNATCHQEASVSLDCTMKIILLIYFTSLVKVVLPPFHYSLGISSFSYTFY